ncbi:MAG: GntR family transcriptional regulator [Armatimonadetes bacterium]|nr:GntR family transcriptional regulator [Armatimonadota bacterium]
MSIHPAIEVLDKVVVIDARREVPLHAQVRRALRQAIDTHFDDGQKFWPEATLIEHLQVSQATMRRALGDLSGEGVLIRRPPRGSFVCKNRKAQLSSIGIFIPEYDSAFFAAALEQISSACRERNLALQICHTHKGERVGDAFAMVKQSPDEERFILLGNSPQTTAELFANLSAHGYRGVSVDALPDDFQGAYVGVDNEAGMKLGMEHLLELGHRRIVLLANEPEVVSTVRARRRAFEAICHERKWTECRVVNCGTQLWESAYDAAYRAMDEVLVHAPTAIFTTSDIGAWAALKWLAEKNVRVPQQISVVGFDDDRPSRFTHPALTTIAHPIGAIARRALEILCADENKPAREFIAPSLVVRESTGQAPGRGET